MDRDSLQLWGGIECTLNRVGDNFHDQLARNGHYLRRDDLERFAALGLRTLRYPLLWERAVTASPDVYDWAFADERLPQLRELGITPIAGLVHHGSGPRGVDPRTPQFAQGLASYAQALARRYPWLEWYTPVNEPLTTARFCGLYGFWHPHARSDRDFVRILLEQCRGTVLSMRAIRRINPGARLVQTDDLGQVYGTQALRQQAEFENHRRWLGWDLLCGRVDASHPLYHYLLDGGATHAELAWLRDNPCPPDVIGIDHYMTSDRFLDERLDRYPETFHGGNGRQRYADVEAVRVLERCGTSLSLVIEEAAHRYGLPIALTENHIGCTVDQQQLWLHEAWKIALEAHARGIDILAVTAWALLGSYDWNTLLTAASDHYEPGAFDTRDGDIRPTALAPLITALARGTALPSMPSPASAWWRQPERLIYGSGVSTRLGQVVRAWEAPTRAAQRP